MTRKIARNDNIITVESNLDDFHQLLAKVYDAIERRDYQDLLLDVKNCVSAF